MQQFYENHLFKMKLLQQQTSYCCFLPTLHVDAEYAVTDTQAGTHTHAHTHTHTHTHQQTYKTRTVTLAAHAWRVLHFSAFINPRRACAARVTVLVPYVCLSVCYHVFCLYAQRGNKIAIRGGLLLQRLHFKKGDFRKTVAFKSYGLKTKRTS